jgi:UDP-N-acetylglucosamine--N-acetylmuramyl-(pentapeptide) pyrophosphoryl-undecaprenol N-acetylglucosamine transferase
MSKPIDRRKRKTKVIFAAGGTCGHLFPAMGLADLVLKKKPEVELMFAGAKLTENVHFDKAKFPFVDITSTTPFRGGFFKAFKSIGTLLKGIRESLTMLGQQKPDLIVGFGSFHAFPILCAAAIKRIPTILFESNSVPGKVIRIFSRRALVTAIYLKEARNYLKGRTVEVEMPIKNVELRRSISQGEARHQLRLESHLPTLLVFGGSQGASGINRHVIDLLSLIKKENMPLQLIHLTGNQEMATEVSELCASMNIPCHAKKFESQMDVVWSAADLAICRSGAMTLSEILHYEVPAILIPYPFAADRHQLKNAQFLEREVGGAIHYPENTVSATLLIERIRHLFSVNSPEMLKMKNAIKTFKSQQKKEDLSGLIVDELNKFREGHGNKK